MITDGDISRLAKKFQIDRYSIIREYIQLVFLKYLYADKMSGDIYFKGGTMIHLLMKSFRFSEDLDFSTTRNIEEVESKVKKVMGELASEVPDIRYTIKEKWHDAFTGQISYNLPDMRIPLTVKLEISAREKPITKAVTLLETEFPVMPYPLIVHLDWEEVLAEKVRALLLRRKGRDVFDLWFLLSKGIKLNPDMIRKKMMFYKKDISDNVLDQIKNSLSEFKEEEIDADLRRFIPATHRGWLKQLKQDTLKKLN